MTIKLLTHFSARANAQTRMDLALKELANQLDAGGEFPDLTWKIALDFKVNCEDLEGIYMDMCGDGTWPPEEV